MTYREFKKQADYVGYLDNYMMDNPKFLNDTINFKGDWIARDIDQYNRLKKAIKLMLAGKGPVASGFYPAQISAADMTKPVKELYLETPYGESVVPWKQWKSMVKDHIRATKAKGTDDLNWWLRNAGYYYAKTGENELGIAEPQGGVPVENLAKMISMAYADKKAPERIKTVKANVDNVIETINRLRAQQKDISPTKSWKAWQKEYDKLEDAIAKERQGFESSLSKKAGILDSIFISNKKSKPANFQNDVDALVHMDAKRGIKRTDIPVTFTRVPQAGSNSLQGGYTGYWNSKGQPITVLPKTPLYSLPQDMHRLDYYRFVNDGTHQGQKAPKSLHIYNERYPYYVAPGGAEMDPDTAKPDPYRGAPDSKLLAQSKINDLMRYNTSRYSAIQPGEHERGVGDYAAINARISNLQRVINDKSKDPYYRMYLADALNKYMSGTRASR